MCMLSELLLEGARKSPLKYSIDGAVAVGGISLVPMFQISTV